MILDRYRISAELSCFIHGVRTFGPSSKTPKLSRHTIPFLPNSARSRKPPPGRVVVVFSSYGCSESEQMGRIRCHTVHSLLGCERVTQEQFFLCSSQARLFMKLFKEGYLNFLSLHVSQDPCAVGASIRTTCPSVSPTAVTDICRHPPNPTTVLAAIAKSVVRIAVEIHAAPLYGHKPFPGGRSKLFHLGGVQLRVVRVHASAHQSKNTAHVDKVYAWMTGAQMIQYHNGD